ncbi:MAG TPA: hypothetical protein DIU39_08005 [Flavobacteriales bacterium]|nr:hypothetical protein [Flavobacteriales bacterium]
MKIKQILFLTFLYFISIELVFSQCYNPEPIISGINNGGYYSIDVEVDENVTFFINVTEGDENGVTCENVFVTTGNVNNSIPTNAIQITQNSSNAYTINVDWTPTQPGSYCFDIVAYDDCPDCKENETTVQKAFCIEVRPNCIGVFQPIPGKRYVLSAWVKESTGFNVPNYIYPSIDISFPGTSISYNNIKASGKIIEGWQRIEYIFTIPSGATQMLLNLKSSDPMVDVFFDDIRLHPFDATMASYVYDFTTGKLLAQLDENNYATFYVYDDEGNLKLIKKETERGVMTIQEGRNAKHVH